jgi:serine/threonine protein kinase
MQKNNNNPNVKKNNINNSLDSINNKLLNLVKYKLYQTQIGRFYENPKINSNLNFSSLEPILSKGKKILVGDGSFSKVYLYQHKNTKIKYAIKKMNIPSFIKKTNNKNLILEEINIQSKISHPNIIRLFNYFKDKNNTNVFLILEYASKGTLFDYIRRKKGLDESEAFYYFFQAFNAIFFLHKNKIIHRDLKPENLLINHNNILKLCDFGWSVYLNNSKRVTFCGTVEYMAPEIVKNEGYDYSIDVWSLGVLLYELIHSHSPFVVKDLNINKIENNIVSKELRFKKGVSLECRDLIEKLLIKDAKNRIKIGEIYKHPFILKYINMLTNYIKINQFENCKKFPESKDEDKEKNQNTKREKFDEIRESFSEFDTIPNEPEPSKILVNFDNIVRKFTKIDNNKNIKQRNEKNKNKNKMINMKSLKSLIHKNLTNEIKHKKSFSLNNTFFQKLGFNNPINNNVNEKKDKFILKQNSEGKENKNMNLNKENLLKLLIKKSKYDVPDLQIQLKKLTKNTLMEEYNNNLNKKYMNKNKINELDNNDILYKNYSNNNISKNNFNILGQNSGKINQKKITNFNMNNPSNNNSELKMTNSSIQISGKNFQKKNSYSKTNNNYDALLYPISLKSDKNNNININKTKVKKEYNKIKSDNLIQELKTNKINKIKNEDSMDLDIFSENNFMKTNNEYNNIFFYNSKGKVNNNTNDINENLPRYKVNNNNNKKISSAKENAKNKFIYKKIKNLNNKKE